MDFDVVVLLVIALSIAIHWPEKGPRISNSWLTHISSADQAESTPDRPSRWARNR